MPDYAQMYVHLFRATTKAIELLQAAQQETEELYLAADKPPIQLVLLDEIRAENEEQ